MEYAQKIVVLALLALCCVSMTSALRCYYCDSVSSCKSAKKHDCNQVTANATRNYLDVHYKNVNMNTTSAYFTCLSDRLTVSNGDYQYKGCLYTTINACQLQVRDGHTSGTVKHTCSTCNSKDYCNPAARADINVMSMVATIAAAAIITKWWSH